MGIIQAGIISDTHGLLRPSALAALEVSSLILHAGDVGKPEILVALRSIAPVHAVRGNVDRGAWAEALPLSEVVQAGEVLLYLYHGHLELDLDPAAAGFAAVISGHTHSPSIAERNGVMYINPGSAGPRRFKLPVTLARLTVNSRRLDAEVITLE